MWCEKWNLVEISAELTATKTLRDIFNFIKGCSGNFQCNLCHDKISRLGARRIASSNKAFHFRKYKRLVILACV